MLLLCSPSNPTGSMYSPEELAALADVVLEKNLLVVSDEIYERLIYGGHRFASFATRAARPGRADDHGQRREQGLRDDGLADRLDAVAGERGQGDGRSAKPGNVEPVAASASTRRWRRSKGRRNASTKCWPSSPAAASSSSSGSPSIAGLSCREMGGAFYAFINIQRPPGPQLRRRAGRQFGPMVPGALVEQQNVATVMGSAFGAEGYARLSFATSMENLETGFDRIEAFVRGAR